MSNPLVDPEKSGRSRLCGTTTANRTPPAFRIAALAALLAVSALISLLAPLAARAQSSITTQYLFVPTVSDSTSFVATFTVDPTTGALAPISAPPAPLRTAANQAVVNPAGTFLFISTLNSVGNPAVSVCAIASDGSVAEIAASPFSGSSGTTPIALAVSRDGKYLYLDSNNVPTAGVGSGSLDVFSIGSDGTLALLNSYPVALGSVGMFLHPTGSWLYLYDYYSPPGSQSSQIEQFDVGPSGTLTDEGAFPLYQFAADPWAITGNSAGTFLFDVHGQYAGILVSIDTLAVNPVDGSLSVASTYNSDLNFGGQEYLGVDSTGQFLFNTLAEYSITNGVLTQIDNYNLNISYVSPTPLLLASPNTPFLFQAGTFQVENVTYLLESDQIGPAGVLTPAPGSPYSYFASALAVTGSISLPNAPAVTLSPTSANFGSVVIGQTSTSSFTVSNSGFAPLSISSISTIGDPSFSQTNNCASTLQPAAQCTVNISFVPTTTDTVTGSVVIASNAPTATFAMTGSGVAPSPNPGVAPATLTFPSTAIGSTSASQSLTLSNTRATAPIEGPSITITGSNPGDFSETNNCPASIAIGASCSIAITFSPLALGSRAAFVNVSMTNDSYSSGATVSGTGVAAGTQFALQTSTVGPGPIQQSPTGTSFSANTSVTLTAIPNANATFTSWSGGACAASTNTVCTFSITTNTSVTATFTADPAVTSPQSTQSGAAGSTFTFQFSANGFSTTPTLTASCNIPKGSCTISGTTLTVTTTANTTSFVPINFPPGPLTLMLALAIMLLSTNPRARRILSPAVLVGCLILLGACGGGGGGGGGGTNSSSGTPAGTYTVTVQAVAGAQTASTTVSVTVQ